MKYLYFKFIQVFLFSYFTLLYLFEITQINTHIERNSDEALKQVVLIDMQDEELCVTMSKLLEVVIMKSTLDKKQFPLISASVYLSKCGYENMMQYYREIGSSIPIDIEYVRFRLLGLDYQVFGEVIRDIVGTFTHYQNVQQRYYLPDILKTAKQTLLSVLNQSQLFYWACDFDDNTLNKIRDITNQIDIQKEQKLQAIQPKEVQYFLYCLETLNDDQSDDLNKSLEYFNVEINEQNEVQLNKLHPYTLRQLTAHLRKYVLSKIQNERVNARIEYWEDIVRQTVEFQISQFIKEELVIQFALPPRFISQPQQYLGEYLLDQMILKPFIEDKILMAYQIIQINPIAKVSPYQPDIIVDAHITVLLMDFNKLVLAEIIKKTEQNIFVKINGFLDGKLILDDQTQQYNFQKEDILRCEIINKENKNGRLYFILKPICKVLSAGQELK